MNRRAPGGTQHNVVGWGVLAALLATRLPALVQPAGSDQHLYQYIADRMLAGDVPYIDAWDQKPPGVFFVYAVIRAIWPHPSAAAVADLVAAAALAGGLVLLGRRTVGTRIGMSAAAVALLWGHPALSRIGGVYVRGQCEAFIAPAITFGLAALARRPRTRGVCIQAGAWLAVAFWLKYNAVAYALPFGVAIYAWRDSAGQRWEQALAWLGAGFLAVSMPLLLYFAAHGALEPLRLATIDYNLRYAGETYAGGAVSVVQYLAAIPLERVRADVLWFFGGIGAAVLAMRSTDTRGSRAVVLAWLAAALMSIAANGARNLPQYFVQAIPALAFAAATGAAVLWRTRVAGRVMLAVVLSVGLWRVGVETPSWLGFRWAGLPQLAANVRFDLQYAAGVIDQATYLRRFTGAQKYDALEIERLTSRVVQTTRPEDRILVFGFAPAVYVNSGRQSASRFFWSRPVVLEFEGDRPGYGSAGLLEDLRAHAPVLVALQKQDWGPTEPNSEAFLMDTPALRTWLTAGYAREADTPAFSIWRRQP